MNELISVTNPGVSQRSSANARFHSNQRDNTPKSNESQDQLNKQVESDPDPD